MYLKCANLVSCNLFVHHLAVLHSSCEGRLFSSSNATTCIERSNLSQLSKLESRKKLRKCAHARESNWWETCSYLLIDWNGFWKASSILVLSYFPKFDTTFIGVHRSSFFKGVLCVSAARFLLETSTRYVFYVKTVNVSGIVRGGA